MALDLGGGIASIGGGIGDLFGAQGSKDAAKGYDAAAAAEHTNAQIAQASVGIEEAAISRDIFKTAGGQRADIAGAGFKMTGTALDLARDTARQGALATALTVNQGAIDIEGHTAQAQMYTAEAQAARAQAKGQGISGIFGIASGILGIFGL
jgi:hypothetical protein